MLIFFPFASSKSRVKAVISAFCAEVLEPRLPDLTTWSAVVTLLYVCPVAQSCCCRCARCPQHPPAVLLSALDGSNTQPQSFPSSHVILVLQNFHQEHVELLNSGVWQMAPFLAVPRVHSLAVISGHWLQGSLNFLWRDSISIKTEEVQQTHCPIFSMFLFTGGYQ